MEKINNSQIALEFFATVLYIKHIIDEGTLEDILLAESISDLDNIIDMMSVEESVYAE